MADIAMTCNDVTENPVAIALADSANIRTLYGAVDRERMVAE
ncbi:MAG: hypothetical protein WA895_38700 [Streptosporangiaceae bacterium]